MEIIDSIFFNGDYLNITIYIEDEQTGELMQTLKSYTFDTILEDIELLDLNGIQKVYLEINFML